MSAMSKPWRWDCFWSQAENVYHLDGKCGEMFTAQLIAGMWQFYCFRFAQTITKIWCFHVSFTKIIENRPTSLPSNCLLRIQFMSHFTLYPTLIHLSLTCEPVEMQQLLCMLPNETGNADHLTDSRWEQSITMQLSQSWFYMHIYAVFVSGFFVRHKGSSCLDLIISVCLQITSSSFPVAAIHVVLIVSCWLKESYTRCELWSVVKINRTNMVARCMQS